MLTDLSEVSFGFYNYRTQELDLHYFKTISFFCWELKDLGYKLMCKSSKSVLYCKIVIWAALLALYVMWLLYSQVDLVMFLMS